MIRRLVCATLGHRWRFSNITLPREMRCVTCGKRGFWAGKNNVSDRGSY